MEKMKDSHQRLHELLARKAERDKVAAQKKAEAAVPRQLALMEALEKAEEEHGSEPDFLRIVSCSSGDVIVKRPDAVLFRALQARIGSDKITPQRKQEEMDRFIRSTVVWPDQDKLDAILSRQPAVQGRISVAMMALAGQQEDEAEEK
jgi:hypothetical protein